MVKSSQLALNDAAEWLGDWHPLAEQLGSADGLLTLGSVSSQLRLPPVHDEIRVHLTLSPRLIRDKKPCFRRAAPIRDDQPSIPAPLDSASSDCPASAQISDRDSQTRPLSQWVYC